MYTYTYIYIYIYIRLYIYVFTRLAGQARIKDVCAKIRLYYKRPSRVTAHTHTPSIALHHARAKRCAKGAVAIGSRKAVDRQWIGSADAQSPSRGAASIPFREFSVSVSSPYVPRVSILTLCVLCVTHAHTHTHTHTYTHKDTYTSPKARGHYRPFPKV